MSVISSVKLLDICKVRDASVRISFAFWIALESIIRDDIHKIRIKNDNEEIDIFVHVYYGYVYSTHSSIFWIVFSLLSICCSIIDINSWRAWWGLKEMITEKRREEQRRVWGRRSRELFYCCGRSDNAYVYAVVAVSIQWGVSSLYTWISWGDDGCWSTATLYQPPLSSTND